MNTPLKTSEAQRARWKNWAVVPAKVRIAHFVDLLYDFEILIAAIKALEEVVQETYGLLWQVETTEQKIHHARRLLRSLIDKDGQRKGIANTRPLDCGHPISLGVISTETGDFLYCELCDARSAKNDAEKMEAEYKDRVDQLEQELKRAGKVTNERFQAAKRAWIAQSQGVGRRTSDDCLHAALTAALAIQPKGDGEPADDLVAVHEALKEQWKQDFAKRVKQRAVGESSCEPAGQDGWQPIATALKDAKQDILVYCASSEEMFVSFWTADGWQYAIIPDGIVVCEPTHWRPLPAPPDTGA